MMITKEERIRTIKNKISNVLDLDNCLADLLDEKDMVNGFPRESGLRKLAEAVIGPIISITSNIQHCTDRSAAVQVTIVFTDNNGNHIKTSGCADVNERNIEERFGIFPTAVAETRAKARAYRAILNLKTCSFDELSKNVVDEGNREKNEYDGKSWIKNAIAALAKKKGLNTDEISQAEFGKTLDQLTHQERQIIFNSLQDN